jgi:CheY-like chemotaxis protein
MCKDQPLILLVDDDVDDQLLLTEEINKLEPSILVKHFNNGMQVMEYFFRMDKNIPCLIILDYNMPVLTGLEILEKLTNIPHLRDVPKIVWSTSSSTTYQHKCLQTGALKYIVKANDMSGLKKIASEMVAACCGVN